MEAERSSGTFVNTRLAGVTPVKTVTVTKVILALVPDSLSSCWVIVRPPAAVWPPRGARASLLFLFSIFLTRFPSLRDWLTDKFCNYVQVLGLSHYDCIIFIVVDVPRHLFLNLGVVRHNFILLTNSIDLSPAWEATNRRSGYFQHCMKPKSALPCSQ
jgi:hypothetical protein